MTGLGLMVTILLVWIWWFPHDLGQWIERVKDPYREKPHHKKGYKPPED